MKKYCTRDGVLWDALLKPLDDAFQSASAAHKGLHDIVMSYAIAWFQGTEIAKKKTTTIYYLTCSR
jgi:hypothetical protein